MGAREVEGEIEVQPWHRGTVHHPIDCLRHPTATSYSDGLAHRCDASSLSFCDITDEDSLCYTSTLAVANADLPARSHIHSVSSTRHSNPDSHTDR
jgi:hypothetical protein